MAAPIQPSPAPGPAPPVPPKKSGPSVGVIALVGLVVLCAVAGVVLVLMTFGEEDQSKESEAEASEKPAKIAAVPVDDKAKAAKPVIELEGLDEQLSKVTVTIQTTPPGAEVFRNGESVGMTPIDRTFERGDEETWQLFLDGYKVEELPVSLDADFHSEIVLEPIEPESRRKAGSGGGKSTSKKASSGSSSGSKKGSRADDDDDENVETKKSGGGRTVITGTTGASLPD